MVEKMEKDVTVMGELQQELERATAAMLAAEKTSSAYQTALKHNDSELEALRAKLDNRKVAVEALESEVGRLEEGLDEARHHETQLEGSYNLATQEYEGQMGRAQVATAWCLIRNVWQMEEQKKYQAVLQRWREVIWLRKAGNGAAMAWEIEQLGDNLTQSFVGTGWHILNSLVQSRLRKNLVWCFHRWRTVQSVRPLEVSLGSGNLRRVVLSYYDRLKSNAFHRWTLQRHYRLHEEHEACQARLLKAEKRIRNLEQESQVNGEEIEQASAHLEQQEQRFSIQASEILETELKLKRCEDQLSEAMRQIQVRQEETTIITEELGEEQGDHDTLKEMMRQAKLDLERAERDLQSAGEDYEALESTKIQIADEKERNEVEWLRYAEQLKHEKLEVSEHMNEAMMALRQSGSPERLRPDRMNASLAEQIAEECQHHQSVAELAQERALQVADLEARVKEGEEDMVDAEHQIEKCTVEAERNKQEVKAITEQNERAMDTLHESHNAEVRHRLEEMERLRVSYTDEMSEMQRSSESIIQRKEMEIEEQRGNHQLELMQVMEELIVYL